MTEEEILDMIERDDPKDRIEIDNFYIKSLERLGWYDILELWGLERCKAMFTERTERSDEYIERMRSALLFNRRHRYKQGIFSSPLL